MLEELKDINVSERFAELMARRELCNPGIKGIRFNSPQKIKAVNWSTLISPLKSELTKKFRIK